MHVSNEASAITRRVKQSLMATSRALHEKRGIGYSSRFRVSEDRLPSGWRCEQKSPKYTVWYDDKGNRYKSSVEVEHAMREQGLVTDVSGEETETEYGGETSEFEPSPVKRPRTWTSVV